MEFYSKVRFLSLEILETFNSKNNRCFLDYLASINPVRYKEGGKTLAVYFSCVCVLMLEHIQEGSCAM